MAFSPLQIVALLQIASGEPTTYNGFAGQLRVRVPALAAEVVVDGSLSEPVWQRAALLTGFSLYRPVDRRSAPDSTETLVWYSPTAIHFGIRAFEPHGAVRATLADRDRVANDDNVEIHLDTFDERRRALVFIVNPLGVQADGSKIEGGATIPGQTVFRGQTDLSPDFVWESRGRVTTWGYEVEIRIPFKSLRYAERSPQDWGIQVVRKVQHSGYEQTWTPAKRGTASFISQAGRLIGLTGMRHGQVVELNPEATTSVNGMPTQGDQVGVRTWRYQRTPSVGGNIKWGLSNSFVLNGTVRPDFSQVEADALQIAGDARFALFYPEKRPFFVESIEQFSVPNNLVYTRRIARPEVAARLTGKFGGTEIALLSALDDEEASLTGKDNPRLGILRLQRGVGEQSTLGFVYTGRDDASSANHVAGIDARLVFRGVYSAQLQFAGSLTEGADLPGRRGPLWEATVDRTGRSFGFRYTLFGVDPDFRTTMGFVPRTGFVRPFVVNRITAYGQPGAWIESWIGRLIGDGAWKYDDFLAGRRILESRLSADNEFTIRGGWNVLITPALGSVGFDSTALGEFYIVGPASGPVRRSTPARIGTRSANVRVATPQFRRFSATANTFVGRDVDFLEPSAASRVDVGASLDWRPSDKARISGSYVSSTLTRPIGDERVTTTRIPRLKVEYQISRPLFVRIIAQYDARTRAALRDQATGQILLVRRDGLFLPSTSTASNDLRVDWLLSYRPSPGTVFFAGYGSSLTETDALSFNQLQRVRDGVFVKLSYLFRL